MMSMEISNSHHVLRNTEKETQKAAETSAKSSKAASSAAQAETYQSTKEYSEYLHSKYSCLMPANGSSVVINPNLLEKAASDEKTAKWLEYNLSLMPDVMDKIYENAARNGSRVVYCEVSFDGYDSMTTVCGVFEADPGTDDAKKLLEEVREKNKERREKQEKMLEKNKERKQAEKVKTENLREKKIVSSDANNLLNMLADKDVIIGNSASITSIDMKA